MSVRDLQDRASRQRGDRNVTGPTPGKYANTDVLDGGRTPSPRVPGKTTLSEQVETGLPAPASAGAYASRLRNVFGGGAMFGEGDVASQPRRDHADGAGHATADGAAHTASGGAAATDFEVSAWNAANHGAIRSFATDGSHTTVQSGGFHAGAQVRALSPAAQTYRVGFVQTLLHSRRDAVYVDINGAVVNHWVVSRHRSMDQLTEIGSPAPWYNASLALAGGTVKSPAMDDYPWISAPNTDGGDQFAGGTWSSLEGEDRFTTWLVAMVGNDSQTMVYLGSVNWHQSWAGQFGDGGFDDFQGQPAAVGAAARSSHGSPVLGGDPPNAGHGGRFTSAPRTAPPASHAASTSSATATPTATTAPPTTAPDASTAATAHGALEVYGGTPPPAGSEAQKGGGKKDKQDRGGRKAKGAAPKPKGDGHGKGAGGKVAAGGAKGGGAAKADATAFTGGGIDGAPLKAQLTQFNQKVNTNATEVKQPEGTDGKPKKESTEDHEKKVSQYEDGVDGIADMIGDLDGFDELCDGFGGLIAGEDKAKQQSGLAKVRASKPFAQLVKMWQGALDGGPDSARMQAAFDREFNGRGFFGSTEKAYAVVKDDAKRQAKEDAAAAEAKRKAKEAEAKAKADADAAAAKADKTKAGKPNAAGVHGGAGAGANAAFLNASVQQAAPALPQFSQLKAVTDAEFQQTIASVDHHAGLSDKVDHERAAAGRTDQILDQLKRAGGGFKEGFVDTVKWGVLAHFGNKLVGGAVEKVIGEKVPIVGPIIMLALDPPWTGKYWHDVGAGFSKGGHELANAFSLKGFENCHSLGDYVGVFCAKLADLFGGFYEILQVINKLLTTLSALALILGAVLIGVGLALAWLGVGAGLIAAGGWLVEAGEVLGDISLALMPVCLALSALSLMFRTAAAFLVPADVYAEQLEAEGEAANAFGNQAGQRVGLSTARAVEQATPIEKPTAKANQGGGQPEAKAAGEGDTAKVVESTKAANDAMAEAAKGKPETKPEAKSETKAEETKPEEHKPDPKHEEHKNEAEKTEVKNEKSDEHDKHTETDGEKAKEDVKNEQEKHNDEHENEKEKGKEEGKDKDAQAKKKGVGRRFMEHLKANLIEAVKIQLSMGRNMRRLVETLGDVPDLFNKGATDRGIATREEIMKGKLEKANEHAEELGKSAEEAKAELEKAKAELEAKDGKVSDVEKAEIDERVRAAKEAVWEAEGALKSYSKWLDRYKSVLEPAIKRAEAGNHQSVMPTAADRKGNAGEDEDGAHHSNERKLRHAEDAKVEAQAELKQTKAEQGKIETEVKAAEERLAEATANQEKAARKLAAAEADPANAEKIAAAEKVEANQGKKAKAQELAKNASELRRAWDQNRGLKITLERTVGRPVEVEGAPHEIVGFDGNGVVVEPKGGGPRKTVAADKVTGDLPAGFAKFVETYNSTKATVDKLSEGQTGGNPGSIASNMELQASQMKREAQRESQPKGEKQRAEWEKTRKLAREWEAEKAKVDEPSNAADEAAKALKEKQAEQKANEAKQKQLEEKIKEEDDRARALRRAKHDHRDNEVYMEKGMEQFMHQYFQIDRWASKAMLALEHLTGWNTAIDGIGSWLGFHVLEVDKEKAEQEEEAKKKAAEQKAGEPAPVVAKEGEGEGEGAKKEPSEEKKEAGEEKKEAGEEKKKEPFERNLINERAEVEEEKEAETEAAGEEAKKAGKQQAMYEQLFALRPPPDVYTLGEHRAKASEAAVRYYAAHAQAYRAYQAELAVTRLAEESKAMAESGKPIKKRAEGMKAPIEKSKADEAQRKSKLDGGETGDIKGSDSKMGGLVVDLISKLGDNSDHLSQKPDGGGAKGNDMAASQDKASSEGKERHGQSKGHSDSQKQFLEQALQVRAQQEASVAQNIQSLEGKSQEEFAIRDEIRVQKANALAEEAAAREETEAESAAFNESYGRTKAWSEQYEGKRKQLDGGGKE